MVERRKEEALREEERSWKYPPRVLYSRYKQNKVFLLYMLLPLLMLLRRWMLLQRREDFAISSRFSPLRSWQKGNNTGPPLFFLLFPTAFICLEVKRNTHKYGKPKFN
jgi:hypothetical protein